VLAVPGPKSEIVRRTTPHDQTPLIWMFITQVERFIPQDGVVLVPPLNLCGNSSGLDERGNLVHSEGKCSYVESEGKK
jgi:hypothetical protein